MSGYLSVRTVVQAVAAVTGIMPPEITGARRTNEVVRPRHLVMYFAGIYCPQMTLPQIGRALGGRDHTTVIHGRNKIAREVETCGLDAEMREIKAILDTAMSVLSRITVDDIPDSDPLAIAERSMTDHGVTRVTYDEIKVMAQFIITIVTQGKLIHETSDEDASDLPGTVARAARRVVLAHRALEEARFGSGEGSAAQALGTAIEVLGELYARDIGPLPTLQPAFKHSSISSRKDAANGHG
jgi:hypothetical protein